MNFFNTVYKLVTTYSFKEKNKLLNSLTYNGDDMLEDPEVYDRVYEFINNEEKENEHNPAKDSIVNMISRIAMEINGNENYVFKIL